jgi:hypothetical protein
MQPFPSFTLIIRVLGRKTKEMRNAQHLQFCKNGREMRSSEACSRGRLESGSIPPDSVPLVFPCADKHKPPSTPRVLTSQQWFHRLLAKALTQWACSADVAPLHRPAVQESSTNRARRCYWLPCLPFYSEVARPGLPFNECKSPSRLLTFTTSLVTGKPEVTCSGAKSRQSSSCRQYTHNSGNCPQPFEVGRRENAVFSPN